MSHTPPLTFLFIYYTATYYNYCVQVLPSPVDDGLFGTVDQAMTSPFPLTPVKYVFGEAPPLVIQPSTPGTNTVSLFPPSVQVSMPLSFLK